jgi:hypothetical protein
VYGLCDIEPGITEDVRAAVWQQSGGHPFIAQYILHHLWLRGAKSNFANVYPDDVARIAGKFIRTDGFHHIQGWKAEIDDIGLQVYRHFAEHEGWINEDDLISSMHQTGDEIRRGLVALCYHGLLTHDEDWQCFHRTSEIWRSWYLSNYFTSEGRFYPGRENTDYRSKRGYVFCIGVQTYNNLRHLKTPLWDAQDIHRIFVDNGYTLELLLTDTKATKQRISEGLNWLAHQAQPDDTVIIYFSGHGVQLLGGLNPGEYLCPIDASLDRPNETLISSNELNKALQSINAQQILLFLDACRSAGVLKSRQPTISARSGLSDEAYQQLSSPQTHLSRVIGAFSIFRQPGPSGSGNDTVRVRS